MVNFCVLCGTMCRRRGVDRRAAEAVFSFPRQQLGTQQPLPTAVKHAKQVLVSSNRKSGVLALVVSTSFFGIAEPKNVPGGTDVLGK